MVGSEENNLVKVNYNSDKEIITISSNSPSNENVTSAIYHDQDNKIENKADLKENIEKYKMLEELEVIIYLIQKIQNDDNFLQEEEAVAQEEKITIDPDYLQDVREDNFIEDEEEEEDIFEVLVVILYNFRLNL